MYDTVFAESSTSVEPNSTSESKKLLNNKDTALNEDQQILDNVAD